MVSVRVTFFALVIFVLLWVVPAVFSGTTPFFVFDMNRAEILSKSRSKHDVYVFAVGVAEALKSSPSSLDRARQKARLKAQGNLTGIVDFDRRNWPEVVRGSGVGDRIENYLVRIQGSSSVSIEGIQAVFEECHGQSCLSVVAAPASSVIKSPSLSWNFLLSLLDDAYLQGASSLPLYDYLEVCNEDHVDDVLERLAEHIKVKYGDFAGDVVVREPIAGIPVLWAKGRRLSEEKVSQLGQEALFQLLNLDPYDPVVLYYLAKSFDSQGRHRFALLLYSRGTVWFVDPEYNVLCLNSCGVRQESIVLPSNALREKVIASFDESAVESHSGLIHMIIQSLGTLPLADFDLSSDSVDPMVDSTMVINAAMTNPNAINFAALAKNFYARGETLRALPFGIQAATMDSKYEELKTILKKETL
ncbi:MAG: hypothetical protein DRJ64_04215 [Thermoprotei archaeon]|nr:MAG: hypothetical protein DRJ64_04215 [Thermoprotei archaeon]